MFRWRSILCLMLAGVLAACSAATSAQNESLSSSESLSSYARAQRNGDGPYILGPNDTLKITVYSDQQLTGEYQIGSNGYVSIPLAGQVKAAGLTTRQFEQRLAARMKGKLVQNPNSPEISVAIAAYAPFYIYGEVKKAGNYPFVPGLTVADAIATAGGLTYRANENKIYIRPAGQSAEQIVSLDHPVRILPGDNIRVSERMF